MKIYSKLQDYYDSCLGYGIDEQCHYSRVEHVFKAPRVGEKTDCEYSKYESYLDRKDDYGIQYLAIRQYRENLATNISGAKNVRIAFCGKMYYGICINYYDISDNLRSLNSFWIWSLEDLDAFVEKYGSKNYKKIYNDSMKEKKKNINYSIYGKTFISYRNIIDRQYMMKVFEYYENRDNRNLIDLHHETGVPVIMYENINNNKTIVYNPVLKEIAFYKAVDPFQAFQEISMFISGVLGGNSPKMVELSDEMRIAKHGFDDKSFRKEKTKNLK